MYLTRFYYPWHTSSGDAEPFARLSPRQKELVRLRIATLNGCKTCKAARLAPTTHREDEAMGIDGYEGSADYTADEKAAIHFAELLALQHDHIGDADMATLREHFDDAQILELMMMAGSTSASAGCSPCCRSRPPPARCRSADECADELCFLARSSWRAHTGARRAPARDRRGALDRIARMTGAERVRLPRPRPGARRRAARSPRRWPAAAARPAARRAVLDQGAHVDRGPPADLRLMPLKDNVGTRDAAVSGGCARPAGCSSARRTRPRAATTAAPTTTSSAPPTTRGARA